MTPKTKMSGEKCDKATFCEFGWYQWVYCRGTSVNFSGENIFLGMYCGPSIGVRAALIVKILRNNGQQVHRYIVPHIGYCIRLIGET